MGTIPRRRRAASYATAAAVTALLAGCAGAPTTTAPADRPARPAPERPAVEEPVSAVDFAPLSDPLLEPLRAALQRGDWLAATLALPTRGDAAPVSAAAAGAVDKDRESGADAQGDRSDPDADPAADAWLTYYALRIARLRGDLSSAATLRAQLATVDEAALQRELTLLSLRDAQLAGRHRDVADAALALYRAGGHPHLDTSECEALLWEAVQAQDPGDADGTPWASWQALATAARTADGAAAANAIGAWLQENPVHPARQRAETLLGAALADATLARPALLLPLSGPLARAGDALASGAMAAYFAGTPQARQVVVIDSRRFNRIGEAYETALAEGADAVLGPLGKQQVGELLRAGYRDVPLLTLNRPEQPVPAAARNLQLSLAPEDEATQIARRAFAAGARRALLLRPEGDWGNRMETALLAAWQPLGGRTVARAAYGNEATYSTALQAALNLDASTARQRDLRTLFPEPVESVGQRRRDIDVIFMLARNSAEARALKPLINYHYAGDLLVYALSSADDGVDDAGDRDLNGIRLPVMPWRLAAAPPGLEEEAGGGSFAALHALGADGWQLALRANRIASGTGLRHRGYTAVLGAGSDGALLRELPMAEFDGGRLTAR